MPLVRLETGRRSRLGREETLAVIVGVPLLVVLSGPIRWVVAATLVVGCVYGLLRRRLANLAPKVVGKMPDQVGTRVPERYRR